ncbi:hypothetical protein [Selenomonas ruminantium]|uniref:Uncharacterized protein n=1 Tax=Selenomonas ruminantium TaxID=971 RepID=A0A1I0YA33_SELRU|nr:hypothetical protein [Selenomonas ruminantium]SFB10052.1 hypothetical protein SAMN05216587_11126 [Selenomonas ruminantium]
MYIKKEYSFTDLLNNSWSGATQVLEKIEEDGRENEAMGIIEETFYGEVPTDTQVNDFIWFDLADIMGLYEE